MSLESHSAAIHVVSCICQRCRSQAEGTLLISTPSDVPMQTMEDSARHESTLVQRLPTVHSVQCQGDAGAVELP